MMPNLDKVSMQVRVAVLTDRSMSERLARLGPASRCASTLLTSHTSVCLVAVACR